MTNEPTTTLFRILVAGPCIDRWTLALEKAGGMREYGADTPITVRQIVEAMSIEDALWCLCTMPEHNNRWRQFAVSCARRVQHLMNDPRSLAVLDVAERHAHGLATDTELSAAEYAAWEAERHASEYAPDYAMWAASRSAALTATWNAGASTWIAARDAAKAAGAMEREWQAAELIRICEAAEFSASTPQ